MIAIIRIHGQVKLRKEVIETLNRLRLRKKYSCVVFANLSKEQLGMIKKVTEFVAFGEINKETFEKLIEARAQPLNKKLKIDSKKVLEELMKGKKYEELNLRPFFRLHPPRGGIESKKQFGVDKGVLGNNKEKINELVLRML